MLSLSTELHFVPLSCNYTELVPLAILARELGINAISVLRFVPQGRGREIESQKLNADQNRLLKVNIESLRKDGYNIRTGSPYNFLLLNDQPQCCAGIDRMTILPIFAYTHAMLSNEFQRKTWSVLINTLVSTIIALRNVGFNLHIFVLFETTSPVHFLINAALVVLSILACRDALHRK